MCIRDSPYGTWVPVTVRCLSHKLLYASWRRTYVGCLRGSPYRASPRDDAGRTWANLHASLRPPVSRSLPAFREAGTPRVRRCTRSHCRSPSTDCRPLRALFGNHVLICSSSSEPCYDASSPSPPRRRRCVFSLPTSTVVSVRRSVVSVTVRLSVCLTVWPSAL